MGLSGCHSVDERDRDLLFDLPSIGGGEGEPCFEECFLYPLVQHDILSYSLLRFSRIANVTHPLRVFQVAENV